MVRTRGHKVNPSPVKNPNSPSAAVRRSGRRHCEVNYLDESADFESELDVHTRKKDGTRERRVRNSPGKPKAFVGESSDSGCFGRVQHSSAVMTVKNDELHHALPGLKKSVSGQKTALLPADYDDFDFKMFTTPAKKKLQAAAPSHNCDDEEQRKKMGARARGTIKASLKRSKSKTAKANAQKKVQAIKTESCQPALANGHLQEAHRDNSKRGITANHIDEKEDKDEQGHKDVTSEEIEGVRRSARQRKLTYDYFNDSWILDSQHLKGYLDVPGQGNGQPQREQNEESNPVDTSESIDHLRTNVTDGNDNSLTAPFSPLFPEPENHHHHPTARSMRYPMRTRSNIGRKNNAGAPSTTESSEREDDELEIEASTEGSQCGEQLPKYHLRKVKPVVNRFQVPIASVKRTISTRQFFRHSLSHAAKRRSIRIMCSPKKHRHRSSSSDSSDDGTYHRKKRSLSKLRNSHHSLNLSREEIERTECSRVDPTRPEDTEPGVNQKVCFDSIGGLKHHIQQLKEMIIFPLVYPEVFEKLSCEPPKGVILYGPPGTGKTLVAKALANECSNEERKVAFFMRKGADILNMWVGESERQLRHLFEEAHSKRPSIIFFDEIDGLAPARSSRQDQVHASVVTTLLALMDGVNSRGEIVVIGATNRLEAIDPALRRPGRFDRELYFSLPTLEARQEILTIHTRGWEPKVVREQIKELAELTVGYCGADLKSLCTEACLSALRRRYPQIYKTRDKLLLDLNSISVTRADLVRALGNIVPAGQRSAARPGRKLSDDIHPLLVNTVNNLVNLLKGTFPHGFCKPGKKYLCSTIYRPRLLLTGNRQEGHSTHVAPALLHQLEHLPVLTLDLPTVYANPVRSAEEACTQVLQEAIRSAPCILYVSRIDKLWEVASPVLRTTFLSLLQDMDPSVPMLLLATSECPYNSLAKEIRSEFCQFREEVYQMQYPSDMDRQEYFAALFLKKALQPPPSKPLRRRVLEKLGRAPNPEPRTPSHAELEKLLEREETALRKLRIYFRDALAKLVGNRQFCMFVKPVSVDEVPDYLDIIKQPMDLETMMAKVDQEHYLCSDDFLRDINLICKNALDYNPPTDPADKLVRHRACTLRDTAHDMIKSEMDSELEETCRKIASSRNTRNKAPSVPRQGLVHASQPGGLNPTKSVHFDANKENNNAFGSTEENTEAPRCGAYSLYKEARAKRKTTSWARGLLTRKKRKNVVKVNDEENKENGKLKKNVSDNDKASEFSQPGSSIVGKIPEDNIEVQMEMDSAQVVYEMDFSTNENETEMPTICESSRTLTPDVTIIAREASLGQDDRSKTHADDVPKQADSRGTDVPKGGSAANEDTRKVAIDQIRLTELLNLTVEETRDCPIEQLEQLYAVLNSCICSFLQQWDRTALPDMLEAKLLKFKTCSQL